MQVIVLFKSDLNSVLQIASFKHVKLLSSARTALIVEVHTIFIVASSSVTLNII